MAPIDRFPALQGLSRLGRRITDPPFPAREFQIGVTNALSQVSALCSGPASFWEGISHQLAPPRTSAPSGELSMDEVVLRFRAAKSFGESWVRGSGTRLGFKLPEMFDGFALLFTTRWGWKGQALQRRLVQEGVITRGAFDVWHGPNPRDTPVRVRVERSALDFMERAVGPRAPAPSVAVFARTYNGLLATVLDQHRRSTQNTLAYPSFIDDVLLPMLQLPDDPHRRDLVDEVARRFGDARRVSRGDDSEPLLDAFVCRAAKMAVYWNGLGSELRRALLAAKVFSASELVTGEPN